MEHLSAAVHSLFDNGTVPGYMLTKLLLQRGLALVYLLAFAVAWFQFRPLLGEHGLLPVPEFVKQVRFGDAPSLFHWLPYDKAFAAFAAVGMAISALALFGVTERFGKVASIASWALLWVLYLSFVNVGQTFYGFGWESMLCEAGFLAMFLGPAGVRPPFLVIFMFRWLLFRTMFGAGMIKLRGDPCWKDLTCLYRHFETQPMPNPLSWYFHWLPRPLLQGGVLYNHFVELVAPFAYFLFQPVAAIAGALTLVFHGILYVSGNFAWLNFMTLVLTFSTLDDRALKLVPGLARFAADGALPGMPMTWAVLVLFGLVAMLSIFPIINLFSRNQAMNASYNPYHLVGSYGAFGDITEKQFVVVVEGTDADDPSASSWKEYGFRGRPLELDRMPPQLAPYHERLGWLMWFAGFTPPEHAPWFQFMMGKLLAGDKGIATQLDKDPFPEKPPKYVRAILYEYHFTTPEERKKTGNWWTRKPLGEYFPVIDLDMAKSALPSYLFK